MTTVENGGDQLSDENTDIGIRIRLRDIEARQQRIEEKLDRLLLAFVGAAIGYALSIWAGLGGPTG